MQTIDDIIKANNLDFKVERSPNNPHTDQTWGKTATHWYYTLMNRSASHGYREMTGYYSMGSGHKGKAPTLRDVLDCLASDASGADEMFETWAVDLGYDTDSRKAYAIWEVVREQTQRLKQFLGCDAFDALMNAERL